MARIVVLSRRSIRHPLSGGAGRYIHEIFRRLTPIHRVTVLADGGPDCEAIEEIDGITYRHFPGFFLRATQPIRYVTEFASKADILIDNADVAIPWMSPLFSRAPRITIIHQLVREIFYHEFPRPVSDLGFLLEPFLYRLYSQSNVVAASSSTAEDLIRCGVPKDKISVVTPGCAIVVQPPVQLSLRSPHSIGCVSRLVRYKGLQIALRAIARVVNRFPDTHLFIAGVGPYDVELQRLADKLGLSENVTFLGRISEHRKFRLYSGTRISIAPSQREGFGISVMEANSVGTPVVGWNVPGLRDSIVDGTTGLLAPFADEEIFAHHVATLLTDDHEWNRLSENASKWAREHSWDKSAGQFEQLVERALNAGLR
jgi:glycosyltransferase involved in cell wall biosynthesis